MKISSMHDFSASNLQSFKGLWGKPRVEAVSAPGAVYRRTEEFYYPFKNESKNSIDNAVFSRTDSFKVDWDETLGDIYDTASYVTLKNELDFTETEYKNYKNHKYDKPEFSTKRNRIEKSLEENHLSEYKNRKSFFRKLFGK